ncbi:TetR/AcrR family transcriptional regulator [bacterium]|nr:TetR/AcrR family transcriptional regulator [bacterium]
MTTDLRKRADLERKRKSREALLAAARRVFASRGYHATLIADIVAEAGFGQGTFYRHFEDKREIFVTLLSRLSGEMLEQFSAMSARLPQNEVEYRAASIDAVTRAAHVAQKNRDLALLFLREARSVDREIEALVEEVFSEFALLARHYLDHAIAAGFARPCDTRVVSRAIVGMATQFIDLWVKGEIADGDVDAVVRELVDFAFLGFGPGAAHSGAARENESTKKSTAKPAKKAAGGRKSA